MSEESGTTGAPVLRQAPRVVVTFFYDQHLAAQGKQMGWARIPVYYYDFTKHDVPGAPSKPPPTPYSSITGLSHKAQGTMTEDQARALFQYLKAHDRQLAGGSYYVGVMYVGSTDAGWLTGPHVYISEATLQHVLKTLGQGRPGGRYRAMMQTGLSGVPMQDFIAAYYEDGPGAKD